MNKPASYPRINIYLDDPELRVKVKIAAARKGMTVSAYCLEVIRHRLNEEEEISQTQNTKSSLNITPKETAAKLRRLQKETGPTGILV
jgi:predicted DNA-binding protein